MSHTAGDAPPLRTTPLHGRHDALDASFTDFGGWSMPIRYTSELAEHRAVREAAGLFDISHMAEFFIDGPDAGGFLDHALAGRLSTLATWKAKYSLLLDETGGILDDVIVYRLAEDRFLVIANAGNRNVVSAAFAERLAGVDATVTDASDDFSLIAVQGPSARAVLEAASDVDGVGRPLDELAYYSATEASFHDVPLLIARTGYTGEDGFEILLPNEGAVALWDALLTVGEPLGLVPAGLAARDTLRLEAGMPLYGHELSRSIRPAQAGLGRVVAGDKDFVGRDGVNAALPADAPVLVGLVSEGKRAGRAGYAVYDPSTSSGTGPSTSSGTGPSASSGTGPSTSSGTGPSASSGTGRVVGEITSGALSPTLGHPIAMAFVSPDVSAPGTVLDIDVRGTRIPASVTPLPFYRRNK